MDECVSWHYRKKSPKTPKANSLNQLYNWLSHFKMNAGCNLIYE
jgi:hypothetical protein